MTEMFPEQMSLGVSLKDDSTFSNFYQKNGNNAQAVFALLRLVDGVVLNNYLIWGVSGCGLTHLLKAMCYRSQSRPSSVQYIPLKEVINRNPEEICDGLEKHHIVCFDDIDCICGHKQWEQSLFHLFNRVKDSGGNIVFASHTTSPPALPIQLADLKSRILGCLVYHIESMQDKDKQEVLTWRAHERGMEMPSDVAKYILNRASRDTKQLFDLLNQLDEVSLREQRKLTIPFVKETLGL